MSLASPAPIPRDDDEVGVRRGLESNFADVQVEKMQSNGSSYGIEESNIPMQLSVDDMDQILSPTMETFDNSESDEVNPRQNDFIDAVQASYSIGMSSSYSTNVASTFSADDSIIQRVEEEIAAARLAAGGNVTVNHVPEPEVSQARIEFNRLSKEVDNRLASGSSEDEKKMPDAYVTKASFDHVLHLIDNEFDQVNGDGDSQISEEENDDVSPGDVSDPLQVRLNEIQARRNVREEAMSKLVVSTPRAGGAEYTSSHTATSPDSMDSEARVADMILGSHASGLPSDEKQASLKMPTVGSYGPSTLMSIGQRLGEVYTETQPTERDTVGMLNKQRHFEQSMETPKLRNDESDLGKHFKWAFGLLSSTSPTDGTKNGLPYSSSEEGKHNLVERTLVESEADESRIEISLSDMDGEKRLQNAAEDVEPQDKAATDRTTDDYRLTVQPSPEGRDARDILDPVYADETRIENNSGNEELSPTSAANNPQRYLVDNVPKPEQLLQQTGKDFSRKCARVDMDTNQNEVQPTIFPSVDTSSVAGSDASKTPTSNPASPVSANNVRASSTKMMKAKKLSARYRSAVSEKRQPEAEPAVVEKPVEEPKGAPRRIRFRKPFPVLKPASGPRSDEEIIDEHAVPLNEAPIRWMKPKQELKQLIVAAMGTSLQRRSNACGALKVLTVQKKNQMTLVRTDSFLSALVFTASQDIPTEDVELALDARSRAVACLRNVCMPKDNRPLVMTHPGLIECLLKVIKNDYGEARVLACAALAFLAKSPNCREGLAGPELLDCLSTTLTASIPCRDGEGRTSPSATTADLTDKSHYSDSFDTAENTDEENDGYKKRGDKKGIPGIKRLDSIRIRKDNLKDSYHQEARSNASAVLVQLSRSCGVSVRVRVGC